MSTSGTNVVTHQRPPQPAMPPAAPPAGARPAPPPGLVVPGQPAACHPGHPGGGAQRPVVVVVGGGAAFVPGGPAPDPNRLADAARGVRHPGHAAAHRPVPGAQPRPVDPQLVALGVLLGDAAPPASSPGIGQRIAGQLLALLDVASLRLGAVLQRGGDDGGGAVVGGGPGSDAGALAADGADPALAQLPMPRVPQQPPGPMLTLDPTLGTIVHDDGAGGGSGGGGRGIGEVPLGATPTLGDGGTGDAARRGVVPSSWVPVTGLLRQLGAAGRTGAARAMDAVDRLVDRSGLTRGQLALLTLLLPLAVTLLLDALTS